MSKRNEQELQTEDAVSRKKSGTGPNSAGQSGDTQGLSETVEELVEEGQSYEAEVISGVEDAPDPDVSEVHTKQVPEDDVPLEYQGRDQSGDWDKGD